MNPAFFHLSGIETSTQAALQMILAFYGVVHRIKSLTTLAGDFVLIHVIHVLIDFHPTMIKRHESMFSFYDSFI